MSGGAGTGDRGCRGCRGCRGEPRRGEAGQAEAGRGEAGQGEAGRGEAGRWPELEAALAVVNRDVRATLPGQEPLILMVTPAPDGAAGSDGSYGGQVYVAMADGRSHGNPVHAGDLEEGGGAPPEPGDAATVLSVVAEAAQETVMELLWRVWPLCREHGTGMHPRPAGTSEDWCPDETAAAGPPVWWCRGGRNGGCHDASPIGELADTLRGKERRALRRGGRR
ncbi:hypothetical protein ME763_08365 [Streptomyces murinus]|uniref:hypothetical protein n=1 Tax=Streptomyces murinus TaxID=33900 RepID=UPI0023793136|nr:hypothetical protein [Streptomyces murinus]WDO05673.1 hypothetical protein ME763_08365 [Streptomyces murinus]